MKSTTKTKGNYNNPFATKLRELLDRHPKTGKPTTKTELGKLIGATQQAVSKWADGENTPKLETLIETAKYFEVSVDELATGVAYENKDFNYDTGLSNNAINILKKYQDTVKKNPEENSDKKNLIEFLNIIIESISLDLHMPLLATRSINYIFAVHNHILAQTETNKKAENNDYRFLGSYIGNFDLQSDQLDFIAFQLKKDFDRLINALISDEKVRKQVCRNCKATEVISSLPSKSTFI